MPPMRRLARRLFTLFSAISLLLCVTACVLWVRSLGTVDSVTVRRERASGSGQPGNLIAVRPEPFYDYVEIAAYRGRVRLGMAEVRSGPVFWRPPPGGWDSYPAGSPQAQQVWDLPFQRNLMDRSWRRRGFEYVAGRSRAFYYYPMIALTVPLWSLAVSAALLPAVWLVRHAKRVHASRRGLCPVCGYDLRASPERCPECGAASPGPAKA